MATRKVTLEEALRAVKNWGQDQGQVLKIDLTLASGEGRFYVETQKLSLVVEPEKVAGRAE